MISERALRKWRKEALYEKEKFLLHYIEGTDSDRILRLCSSNLKMTQELLDQHLLRRKK